MFHVLLDLIPEILREMPYSTIFILALAALISLLTTVVNRRFSHPERQKSWRKEISEWNKALREAQRAKDKKTVDKLMKKQQYVMSLQSKMMWQSMKVSLLFIVPLFIMWQLLGSFYQGNEIAYLPGLGASLPLPFFNYSLIWWYLVCSLLFGTISQHALGLLEVSE